MGDIVPDTAALAAVPAGDPRVLPREFFARPTTRVAADLVGTRLLCDAGTDREVEALVVEVEAYLGLEDPASHAHRGPTPRAAIMFGPPGHLYVYLSYGMHFCANVVCEPEGEPAPSCCAPRRSSGASRRCAGAAAVPRLGRRLWRSCAARATWAAASA